jgi:hypothetical protein
MLTPPLPVHDVEALPRPAQRVRAVAELLDVPGTLVRVPVRQERAYVLRIGDRPGQVESDAAEELGVVGQGARRPPVDPRLDQRVDPVLQRFGGGRGEPEDSQRRSYQKTPNRIPPPCVSIHGPLPDDP